MMPNSGDVAIVDLIGVVTQKRRPVVILSTAAYHAARPDVVVGVITSQIARPTDPADHVLADWAAAGLRLPSMFRAYIVTVPRTQIIRHVGALSAADWQAVRDCVRRSVAT
jgi:mRNA interferase MazF